MKYSISLIREMQIKTTLSSQFFTYEYWQKLKCNNIAVRGCEEVGSIKVYQ